MTSNARRPPRSSTFRAAVAALLATAAVALAGGAPAGAAPSPPSAVHQALVPIGGDYSAASLRNFSAVAAARASGPTLNLLVVPAAYGHEPTLHANVTLALQRTNQVRTACQAILPRFPALSSCDVSLVRLFLRHRSFQRRDVAPFENPELDGVYFLGGIQSIAMHVLGGTPAEAAMADAHARGVVFGGTSAGDAVLSHTMIESFAHGYGQDTELQRSAVLIDWADAPDPQQRGLSFGSDRAIFDEHYYQRGRFGRLLNIVAQSADHFGGAGRLGVGVDFRTGAVQTDDATVRTFGKTSATVIDLKTAHGSHAWVGPDQTLSARGVLTDLIAPGHGVGYDLRDRVALAAGMQVPFDPPGPWPTGLLESPGLGALVLGGDVSGDPSGEAMRAFVSRAQATHGRDVVAVFAAYTTRHAEGRAETAYRDALRASGWTGDIHTVAFGRDPLPTPTGNEAGIVLVGGDQSLLSGPIGDAGFDDFVHAAVESGAPVMTDGAMTAAVGADYVANPDPTLSTVEEQGEADFRTGYNQVEPGLALIPRADFEPRLTIDYRWGRLYGLSHADPSAIVFGVSQRAAIVLEPGDDPTVVGDRPVVSLDGRTATYLNGTNGALSALNVLLNVFAPGDTLGP